MIALTLIFVLSGAAGLIYESVWARYLGLFVGHSAYAQVIVLVIFLGGMSAGAFAAGEWSHRVRRPLRAYAYIELAAGALGLAFHPVFELVTRAAYEVLFPSLAASSGIGIAKWGLSALMILPQSVILGATFPLMTAAAVRFFPGRPGRDIGLLYFANSFGAAIGVLVAGFFLLRIGGLPGTLVTAAVVNFIVFGAAFMIDRRRVAAAGPVAVVGPEPALAFGAAPVAGPAEVKVRPKRARKRSKERRTAARQRSAGAAAASAAPLADPGRLADITRVLLAVSFGTAVASFIYEIAWIRMLSLVLSSATHAFELMLSAFILGLALGAYAISSRVDRFPRPLLTLGLIQWLMGAFALATLPLYVASFHWIAAFQEFFSSRAWGYEGYVISRYAICLAIMLPATFCAGMTLPLITRTLFATGTGERAIGRVYAANTLGSITGVLLAAIVLMPVLGLRVLLATGALADMAIGGYLLWHFAPRRELFRQPVFLAGAGVTVALVAGVLLFVHLDKELLTRGVFRYGLLPERERPAVLFYRDGRTATVSVRYDSRSGWVSLATNGKPDASVEAHWLRPDQEGRRYPLVKDYATQVLLPLVALAHIPQARTGAVIGQGSGLTSHYLLGSPHLASLATIEIEPEMISGSRIYYPLNARVFDDPRSVLVVDDAKSYFASGQRKFDLIVSEPSNPWVSGVSGLFTEEFYRHVRRHLTADGVLGQWLHLYEMTDDMVLSVIAALDAVFGDYQVFSLAPGDILIVATPAAKLQQPDWGVLDYPGVAGSMMRIVKPSPNDLDRLRIAGKTVLHPMVSVMARNSDFHPILDLAAERARYTSAQAFGLMELADRWFDIPAVLEGRRLPFSAGTMSTLPGVPRVDAAAFSASLRTARERGIRPQPVPGRRPTDLETSLRRWAELEERALSGEPPRDWRRWLLAVLITEREIHFGATGLTDDSFFRQMHSYAQAAGAPDELVAAMRYLRAMRAWDFEEVVRLSPILEDAHRRGDPWLTPDALREGTVLGHLIMGDTVQARESLVRLTPLGETTSPGYQFLTRLLGGAVGLAGPSRAPRVRS